MSCLSFGQYACYFKALSEFAVTLTVICYTTSRIIKFMYLLLYFLNYDFSNSKHGYSALRLDKDHIFFLHLNVRHFILHSFTALSFCSFFLFFCALHPQGSICVLHSFNIFLSMLKQSNEEICAFYSHFIFWYFPIRLFQRLYYQSL